MKAKSDAQRKAIMAAESKKVGTPVKVKGLPAHANSIRSLVEGDAGIAKAVAKRKGKVK